MSGREVIGMRVLDFFADQFVVWLLVGFVHVVGDMDFRYFWSLAFIAMFVYSAAGQVWLGQTFAKAVSGFEVVDDNNGDRISFSQGIVRNLHFLLPGMALLVNTTTGGSRLITYSMAFMIPCFLLIDGLAVVLDSKGRSIRDRVAGTIVVKT